MPIRSSFVAIRRLFRLGVPNYLSIYASLFVLFFILTKTCLYMFSGSIHSSVSACDFADVYNVEGGIVAYAELIDPSVVH